MRKVKKNNVILWVCEESREQETWNKKRHGKDKRGVGENTNKRGDEKIT